MTASVLMRVHTKILLGRTLDRFDPSSELDMQSIPRPEFPWSNGQLGLHAHILLLQTHLRVADFEISASVLPHCVVRLASFTSCIACVHHCRIGGLEFGI